MYKMASMTASPLTIQSRSGAAKISAVHALAVGSVISGTNGLSKAGVQLLQLSLGRCLPRGHIKSSADGTHVPARPQNARI
jgi:hypothetical protein